MTVTAQKYDKSQYDESGLLDQSGMVQAGIPNMDMLPAVKFVGEDGGHVGFSSVIPLTSEDTERVTTLVREGAAEAGLDYTATLMINERCAVHVYLAFFDRADDEHTRRTYDTCRTLVQRATALGYGEYRAHVSFMDVVADQFSAGDHAQRRFNERIKDALDPNGILMPGRAGIWPAAFRGEDVPAPWKDAR